MRTRKTLSSILPKPKEILVYTGRGGRAIVKGQTVKVVASARSGQFVVEGLDADGRTLKVSVKGHNLSPLQPQLF